MTVTLELREVERRRLEAGLSQSDVGRRAKVSPVTRRRVFRGRPVRMCVARRIAEALGTTVGELIDVERELENIGVS